MTSANCTPPARADEADPSCESQPAPRLLVIDDDATLRTVIVCLAQKLGYATTEVGTVADASELISTRHFDCMTLDLNLGAQYGTELLGTMNDRQPNVPVIVISSAGDEERWDVLSIAALHGIRVTEVPKPLDAAMLRDVFMELKDVA